jgi:hypothetical protein
MTPLIVDTASLVVLGLVAAAGYVAALYVATAFFVWRDARRRSDSVLFQLFALILGFVPPFLGALVYLMVRPPTTLDQERQLALEEQAILEVDRDEIVQRPCPSCDRVLRLGWPVCPYCAEEVGHAPLGRVTRTG